MHIQDVTARLGGLYQSGQTYRFIEQAHRVLAEVPGAADLAGLTLRALAELGLGGPARELLERCPQLCPDETARGELQSAVAALPNGRVAWSELRGVFERNLGVLVECRPELERCAQEAAAALSGVQLHRSLSGRWLLSRRRPGGLREWLAELTADESEQKLNIPPRGQLGPTVMVGARTGRTVESVYDDTRHLLLTYSHPLYVLEPDPLCFAAWLHLGDQGKWLTDERVYVLVGAEAVAEFERLLAGRPRLGLPRFMIDFCPDRPAGGAAREVLQRVTAQRQAEFDRVAADLGERYRDRDAAYWAERLKPPGLVLGVTSRFTTVLQYSMRDALAAFEALGYRTRMLLESSDHETLPAAEIGRVILEHDPVLLVSLDHLRYEFPQVPENLPFLCWIQDPMSNLLCEKAGRSIGPLDFVCGYYPERCIGEFGYPEDRFEFTNIPVSTRVFHDGELDDASCERYACDVCFVSNASTPIEQFHRDTSATYPEPLRPLLSVLYDRVFRVLEANDYLDFQITAMQLVESAAGECRVQLSADQVEHIKTQYAYRLFDWGRRQQTLGWAADWARRTGRLLRIYGKGWDRHPSMAEFACGVIEHGEPLRRAYRASRLALQLIPEGFRHQRAMEILASGTLPLVRYCPVDFADRPIETYVAERKEGRHPEGVATVFPGLERVVFRTREEFEDIAERYLADEGRRREVLGELREVALRDYTYDAVIRRVFQRFREGVVRRSESAAVAV